MAFEQTLVIVKPDGLQKGLLSQILASLREHNLQVAECTRTHLEPSWVERLYGGEKSEIYFREVVDWVSSSDVVLLRICGENAIGLIKWEIIGRYPNGIRGEYSESWIKNVAHASDSTAAAIRELLLVDEIFQKERDVNEDRFAGKMVFALTGMSESGKSTAGRYFERQGVPGLKIVKLFEEVKEKASPGEDLGEFVAREEARDPYVLWDAFIDELLREMSQRGSCVASIESLYGGGLGPYLKNKMGRHFAIIYIDIPLEIRAQRQMGREGLASLGEARSMLVARDEIKEASGIPKLREMADEIVDNSGSVHDLCRAIDEIIERWR